MSTEYAATELRHEIFCEALPSWLQDVTVRGGSSINACGGSEADVHTKYERMKCFMLSINSEVWLTLNQWAVKRRETSYSAAPPPDGSLAKPQCNIIERF